MTARTGIIFDLDGTLVHSSPDIAHHLNQALARLRPGTEALSDRDVETLIGGGMEELVQRGMTAMDIEPDPAVIKETIGYFRDAYEEAPVIHTTVYEGVEDMLAALSTSGHAIGLCTNKREVTARLVLDHFDLDKYFKAIIGGDTTPTRKPDPQSLIETARQLECDPGHCVMVGDSKADFGAARAAGASIIMVDWGYTAVDIHEFDADAVISSYAEFLPHIASILNA